MGKRRAKGMSKNPYEFRKNREAVKRFQKQRVKTNRVMKRLLKIRKIEVI